MCSREQGGDLPRLLTAWLPLAQKEEMVRLWEIPGAPRPPTELASARTLCGRGSLSLDWGCSKAWQGCWCS